MAARLPYVTREDLPEGDRDIFDRLVQDRAGAPVGHIFRTIFAPSPTRRISCAASSSSAVNCAARRNSIRSCANSRS